VDQSHCLWHIGERPEGCHHHRPRQCLLKGCERLFWPRHWQSHFCSKACQQKARRWRRWKAAQKYRSTDRGKERRREQSRRRRQRQGERKAASADADTPREGQRLPPPGEEISGDPCHRPGCYELFKLPYEHSKKRFCSVACRLALRRVVDRESRYQARRRPMRCERVTTPGQPPDTS
jgi:hypothetical protein